MRAEMRGHTIILRTNYSSREAQAVAGSIYQPYGEEPKMLAEVWSPEYQVRSDPPFFSREDLKRFHAGWLGMDYDSWKDSPGGRDDAGRAPVITLIRNGLRAIFPNATFEDETA